MQDQLNSLEILSGPKCPYLSSLTTFELGSRPKYYAKACSVDQVIAIAKWTLKENIPLWVVGGGSNLLCDDKHLDGLVLQIALEDIEWEISSYLEFGDTQRTDHCKCTCKDHKRYDSEELFPNKRLCEEQT